MHHTLGVNFYCACFEGSHCLALHVTCNHTSPTRLQAFVLLCTDPVSHICVDQGEGDVTATCNTSSFYLHQPVDPLFPRFLPRLEHSTPIARREYSPSWMIRLHRPARSGIRLTYPTQTRLRFPFDWESLDWRDPEGDRWDSDRT